MLQLDIVPSAGERLAVSVDLPDATCAPRRPRPTVLIVHGLTGQRLGKSYHLVEFGRRLAERGVACVRFDQRGCGESTGRFVDLTIPRMVEDTFAVRDWAAAQPWCDGGRLGFVGLSLGALPVVAADADRNALALALWAPVYDMPAVFSQTAKTGLRALLEHQGWVPYRGLAIGAGFVDHLGAIDPTPRLASGDAPLLVCHSAMDDTVGYGEAERYAARCAELGRPCQLVRFATADHDFTEYGDRRRLLETTVGFFLERFGVGD